MEDRLWIFKFSVAVTNNLFTSLHVDICNKSLKLNFDHLHTCRNYTLEHSN